MSEMLRTDRVVAIDKIELKEIKTKHVSDLLKKHNLNSVLIVMNSIDEKNISVGREILKTLELLQ